MSLNFDNKTYSDSILSCSVDGYYDSDLEQWVTEFNDDGPVYGPNGQLELDPDLWNLTPGSYFPSCNGLYNRPVFATCKNNCPGGELCYQLSVLSYFVIIKY